MKEIEIEVANCLIAIIDQLKEYEVPEDASFMAINSTLALIRWLPKEPDMTMIEGLLRHPHMDYSRMELNLSYTQRMKFHAQRMKLNLFFALFMRYGAKIPDRFKNRLFRGTAELEKRAGAKAVQALHRLVS